MELFFERVGGHRAKNLTTSFSRTYYALIESYKRNQNQIHKMSELPQLTWNKWLNNDREKLPHGI